MYTIVIANYNRTKELKRCLDSIELAFKGLPAPEIIVVEDASISIIKDIRIDQHIILDKNGGPVRARLEGAKLASFDYIILLDSDDTLLQNALYTIERVKKEHPNYDLYGFTFFGGESEIDFDIKSIESYSDFVSFEGRTSDYMMIINASVLKKFTKSHSYRVSEIWLFSEMFLSHTGFYSKESIFNYHNDAQEQLSKKKDFKFKLDSYERESVSMSVCFFLSFMSVSNSIALYKAWRRRLLKESFLCFNFKAFLKVLCLRK